MDDIDQAIEGLHQLYAALAALQTTKNEAMVIPQHAKEADDAFETGIQAIDALQSRMDFLRQSFSDHRRRLQRAAEHFHRF